MNKQMVGIVVMIVVVSVFVIGVYAQSTPTVCCERTDSGAWCQNAPDDQCDTDVNPETGQPYRSSPTSCASTSFCTLGCCVDSQEGLCAENTPQSVCTETSGTWVDDSQCAIAQCSLGCCILGDQASFVTLTRCKQLSGFFGLETDFRGDVTNEAQCVQLANAQDKGACVTEIDGQRTCQFGTRGECNEEGAESVEFFVDLLCSADELATNCGPTTRTTCLEGHDEVYFVDSCGNPANIYNADKTYDRDTSYWQRIVPKKNSCGVTSQDGNAGSSSCGNCNYFSGSICGDGNARYGNLVCQDVNCYDTSDGEDYKNGESWCVDQANVGQGVDPVGSRHIRHICINGEEIVEQCADYRNEYCFENAVDTGSGTFVEAACRVNRWEDCIDQRDEESCFNTDKRDCYWNPDVSVVRSEETVSSSSSSTFGSQTTTTQQIVINGFETGGEGSCLPMIPPGTKFWGSSDASGICSIGNSQCIVTFEQPLIGGKRCVDNCHCLKPEWAASLNNVCTSLADCGAYVNVVGDFTTGGAEWKVGDKKKVLDGLLGAIRTRAGV